MTKFGHLSCTQYCCKPLSREWKKNVPVHKVNHSSRETISSLSCLDFVVDSSNDAKWSHASDITNMGQINFYFFQSTHWH